MRKIISLTLATAMVASMAVSAFAAGEAVDTAAGNKVAVGITGEGKSTIKVGGKEFSATGTPAEKVVALAKSIDNSSVGAGFDIYAYAPVSAEVFYVNSAETKIELFAKKATDSIDVQAVTGATVTALDDNTAAPDDTIDVVADWKNDWTEIINPTPLAEAGDWNLKDGVKPGKSIYFKVKGVFADLDYFKFDVSKGENAKQIKKVSVVEKRFNSKLTTLVDSEEVAVDGTDGRNTFVKVDLNDNMTDSEYKVSFDLKVKVDKNGLPGYTKGESSKKFEEIGAVWMYNRTDTTDDTEFMAGTGGIMVKPVKNEENTVLWTDENRDLARLTFTADSDVAKYFPKLSTKWPNATYAQLFDDQDAFVFDFVGNPKISSTSRAVLELFCPFLDSDDEYSVDPESVVIYQVADDATLAASTEVELAKAILDGRLIDVTDKFTAGENEDGDFVYTTKTRTLGTYIIAEKAPSEEAFEEAEGEAPDEKPTEDTGKDNPGTGR